MKVSLNLAQYYSNVDLKSIPADELVKRVGAQLGAVEEAIDWGKRYDGIYVAKVVSCQPHPDSDHMHVCMVDDGGVVTDVDRNADGLVQVVCGAPNVAEGQIVAWLSPGCTVPETADQTEPFVLGSRQLRGVTSNGMIGSARELGLADEHEGILILSVDQFESVEEAARLMHPGTPFKQLLGLDDLIIDCENKMFTHRPDCFGNLGVARELAGISGLKFVSPDWYLQPLEVATNDNGINLQIKNDIPKLVPRFMAQSVSGVKVMPGPLWQQASLSRVGIRPINNLVDWSNYYMHLTGQPTHAFDYDKLLKVGGGDSVTLGPRLAKEGEQLKLLGGKVINLDPADMVICANDVPVGLAGVMGGADTEVDESTTRIVIECATFDMYTIRRSSMRHGLFTDAVTRYNKGQSPWQNPIVLAKLVSDIVAQTGGQTGACHDFKADDLKTNQPIRLSPDFINQRLGSSLNIDELHELLVRVEMTVEKVYDDLSVTAPWWRMDIEIPEDIVEEVGRLYGFDKLPVVLPRRSAKAADRDLLQDAKSLVRGSLAKAGANEVLTYSFVHGDLITKAGQDTKEAYQLRNALSPELQYYRLTLTPSLVAQMHPNLKAGYDQFALFEINKTHVKMHGLNDENVPAELNMIALCYVAGEKTAKQQPGAAFYHARRLLDQLAHGFGLTLRYEPLPNDPPYQVCKPFDWQRSALVYDDASGEFIGQIGEYTANLRRNFKLPPHSAGFEISLEALAKCRRALPYRSASRFPSTTQDITLEADSTKTHGEILASLRRAAADQSDYQIDIEPLSSFRPDTPDKVRHSFRLVVGHPQHTLKTEEANQLLSRIESAVGGDCGATRI